MSAPVFPEPDRVEQLEMDDGTRIHVERFLPDGGSRLAAVIVHGFSSYSGPYRHLGHALAQAGASVTLFDCRGHGQSQGRRGYVKRFVRFCEDLDAVVEHARVAAGSVPLALVGHSHGALIVLYQLLCRDRRADLAILATPWLALRLRVPPAKLLAGRIMARLWPTMPFDNELRPAEATRTPEMVEAIGRDRQIHHVATPRWFTEVESAQRAVFEAAPRLEIPALMLVAGDDRIVVTERALAFAAAAGNRIETRCYESLYHELFLEPERDTVIRDVVTWLMARAFPTV